MDLLGENDLGTTLFFGIFGILVFVLLWYRNRKYKPEGRAILITGCDSGIGYDAALEFRKLGFIVYAGCLLPKGTGANELRKRQSKKFHVIELDVTSDLSIFEAHDYIQKQNTGLWAVINNAGIGTAGDCEYVSMENYKKVMEVNYFGCVRVTKAFIPMLRESKGRIVNTSSVNSIIYAFRKGPYCASKRAIDAFSDCLRLELSRWGVKVIIIQPSSFGLKDHTVDHSNINETYEDLWYKLNDYQKEIYGRQYFDDLINYTIALAKTKCPTYKPVVDAYIEAVLSRNPKTRYLVGGGNNIFYDHLKILMYITTWLPNTWADWFHKTFYLNQYRIKEKSST